MDMISEIFEDWASKLDPMKISSPLYYMPSLNLLFCGYEVIMV